MRDINYRSDQVDGGPVRVRASIVVIALTALSGCAEPPPRTVSVTDSIVAANRCDTPRIPVARAPESLSSVAQCALTTAALHRLANADSNELLQMSPTSAVKSAAIDLMSEFDSTGVKRGTWWVVTLYVPTTATNVEVRFDLGNGSTEIRPVHKWGSS